MELLYPGAAGACPSTHDVVVVHYSTLLARSGRLVDSTRAGNQSKARKPFTFVLGASQVVAGMEQGVRQLTLGALARIHCPADLGYGATGLGKSVPAHADLVFVVELIGINATRTPGIRMLELRQLLTKACATPPPTTALPVPGSPVAQSPAQAAVTREALAAARAERSRRRQVPPSLAGADAAGGSRAAAATFESDVDVEHDDGDEGADSGAAAVSDWPWLHHLTPPRSETLFPEQANFYRLLGSVSRGEWERALRGTATPGGADAAAADRSTPDGAGILLPGSIPIPRAGYHDGRWDSRTPLVLTGERRDWPWFRRGWRYWSELYADELATASQRAPIFDSDRWEESVVSEVSWAEYIKYARGVHRQPLAAQLKTPLLYANGWEVFTRHPELWQFGDDQIGGTIDNLTAHTYGAALGGMGMAPSEAELREHVAHYVKLFVAPRGASTRMHQDNHHAHAWLSQVRGRKLYVLCRPQDYSLVSPAGKSADAGGTTKEARFDPLDAAQRSERLAAGLQIFATVLQPGETLLAPDSWWHYAVSLTPTITLMANFWDHKNVAGLRQLIRDGFAPAPPERTLGAAPVALRVAGSGSPAVVREQPQADAPVLGCLRLGEAAHFDAERASWLRVANKVDGAFYASDMSIHGGWVQRGRPGIDQVWLEPSR